MPDSCRNSNSLWTELLCKDNELRDFMPLATVLKAYQDDGRAKMKVNKKTRSASQAGTELHVFGAPQS